MNIREKKKKSVMFLIVYRNNYIPGCCGLKIPYSSLLSVKEGKENETM